MMNLTAIAEDYKRQKAGLLEAFPELADDNIALADTLDGLNDLTDVVARFIREALEDEALAEALNSRIGDMTERRRRLSDRAAKRKAIALSLMNSVEMPRVEQPEFTASASYSRRAVVVTDENALPDQYVRITRAPDKKALHEALASGNTIPGASLGNGHPTLLVRTK